MQGTVLKSNIEFAISPALNFYISNLYLKKPQTVRIKSCRSTLSFGFFPTLINPENKWMHETFSPFVLLLLMNSTGKPLTPCFLMEAEQRLWHLKDSIFKCHTLLPELRTKDQNLDEVANR